MLRPPLTLLALLLVLAPGAGAEPLRVLAIGDSLTMGIGSTHKAGYRLAFLAGMREAGLEVDMLGKFKSGPDDMDREHLGYPGRGVAKLDQVSFDEVRGYRPDVILLMIGTNDEKSFVEVAYRIRYSVLLDRLLSESRVRVVAATVPPHKFGKSANEVAGVNQVVREEVGKRRGQGKNIRLVDVYGLLDNRADFADALHMNDGGYDKVGRALAEAVVELLAEAPARAAAP